VALLMKSAQLAVSIRHQSIQRTQGGGSIVYLWRESKHKRQTIGSAC
jgi:hypothetical protein